MNSYVSLSFAGYFPSDIGCEGSIDASPASDDASTGSNDAQAGTDDASTGSIDASSGSDDGYIVSIIWEGALARD